MVQSDDIADAGAQGYQGGVDLSDEPAGNWLHMDIDDFQEVFPIDVFPNEKMIVVSVRKHDLDSVRKHRRCINEFNISNGKQ